ncbi:MAG: DUF4253 domain-containing protein [Acidobacteriota bacterium]
MSSTFTSIEKVLLGTSLEGREIRSISIDGCSDKAFAIPLSVADIDEVAWRVGREAIHITSRWPVVVWICGSSGAGWAVDLEKQFTRFPFEQEYLSSRKGNIPYDIIEASKNLDLDRELNRMSERFTEDIHNCIDDFIEDTIGRFGHGPVYDEVAKAIQEHRIYNLQDLESWFFNWEIAANGSLALQIEPQQLYYLDWFVPPQYDDIALVFLPTSYSWEVPAFLSWYGAECTSSELVVALLRDWSDRFGAEIVCHYSTMLQLVTSRLPSSPAEAMRLAVEQYVIAPDTVVGGISIRDHARALLHTHRWFLHARP